MIAVQWPVQTLAGRDLIVRYSLAAQILCGRRGLDPLRLGELVVSMPETPNPSAVRNIMTLFSCCVAENCVDVTNPRCNLDDAPSSDYWAAQCGPDDFTNIQSVLAEALGKAREAKAAAAPKPQS